MIKSRQCELADELSKYFPMSSEDMINALNIMSLYNIDANNILQLVKKNGYLVQDNERLRFVIGQDHKYIHRND